MNPQEQGEKTAKILLDLFENRPFEFWKSLDGKMLCVLSQAFLDLLKRHGELVSSAKLLISASNIEERIDYTRRLKEALSQGAGETCKHLKEEWDHEHQAANNGLYCTCGKKLSGEKVPSEERHDDICIHGALREYPCAACRGFL